MGYKCYDGQLLLAFDYEPEFVHRDPVSDVDPFYIDRDTQIKSFIRSGEMLQQARRDSFEFPDGEVPPDVKVDPTSVVGFDLADASALQKELDAKRAAAANKSEAAAVEPEGVAGETGKSVPPTSSDGETVK